MASEGPRLVDPNAYNPFDLAQLRVSQDFLAQTPTKKLLTTVPIRKPGNQEFVRVHPSPAYRDILAFLKIDEDRETFVVDLRKVPELEGECFVATLFTTITRTGSLFLWPVRVPAADGKANGWNLSAAEAANTAMRQWVRIKSNMSNKAYDVFVPTNKNIPDPEWPALEFQELLNIALKGQPPIVSLDHPAAQRLR